MRPAPKEDTMTTTETTTPVALSHEQIAEMLDLLKDSDSVELKLTVPEHDQRSAVVTLGMDPLEAQIRQVFFFDTPDLALDKLGVVVRARRIQGKGDDSVVKLRPVGSVRAFCRAARAATGFRVEVDALPGGFVCSGTLKRTLDSGEVQRVVSRERPLRKLYSKQQRAYFAEHAPGIELDDLSMLGPIFVLKLRFTPEELRRRIVAEMWLYPDGVARPRALDARCDDHRGVPGRGRGAGLPRSPGHRPLRRAADEDQEGARVLRGGARERAAEPRLGVIPRWEWRAFGESFGGAESRLALWPPTSSEESDDVYLLSAASNASVKVRGGLLDLKGSSVSTRTGSSSGSRS